MGPFYLKTLISSLIILFLSFSRREFDPLPVYLPPISDQPHKEIHLSPNEVEHLLEGQIQGPESLLFDGNGVLYTGVSNGSILQIDPKTGSSRVLITPGYQLNELAAALDCQNEANEHICGRPLGLRWGKNSALIVADAYFGILEIQNSQVRVLVNSYQDEPLIFTNDLVIDSKDNIYFTSSSTKYGRRQWNLDLFEGRGTGKLFKYERGTNTTTLLLDGLFFANGVYLSSGEDFVVVSESGTCRLTRFWLKGENKGTSDTFFHSLPGVPDNLRTLQTEEGSQILVSFAAKRSSLVDTLHKYPILKSLFVKTHLNDFVQYIVPSYGYFLILDENAQIIKSFHESTGQRLRFISEVDYQNGRFYFGSVLNNFISVWTEPNY